MYPQDQEPPTNRNVMPGPPSEPFNYGPPGLPPESKHKLPAWVLWVIGGIVLLAIIVVGLVLFLGSGDGKKAVEDTPTDRSSSQNEEATNAEACAAKLRRYQNQDLDIRFCYPTAWGDVKVADGKFDPSDSGTRVLLSFADKPQVHLGLVSDDWSTDTTREATCVEPGVQAFPDTSNFSARWVDDLKLPTGEPMSSTRGLEITPDELLVQEHAYDTLTSGVCLEGYKAFGGEVYRNAMATYYTDFNDKVTTPKAHIAAPTTLIPVADRTDLTAFVKSIEKF